MPQQRQSLEAQLAASAAALNALKSKGQHLEMDRKTLELDAGTRRESINRLKTQQYETRKNDELPSNRRLSPFSREMFLRTTIMRYSCRQALGR